LRFLFARNPAALSGALGIVNRAFNKYWGKMPSGTLRPSLFDSSK
jgi:hypothetical protein